MSTEVWGMTAMGIAALLAGMVTVRGRVRIVSGAEQAILLGPVFYAVALAVFAAEHFLGARDLMAIVPRWLPGALFWTYLVGAAWLAAAVSFIAWRQVRWSALLTALLMVIIVVTIDLPRLPAEAHQRLFWTLTVRELAFASGALVLAGSTWPRESRAGAALIRSGRTFLSGTMVFYGIEHFFFPRNVTGVPLEKLTPAGVPAPVLLAWGVGIILLVAGIGLLIRPAIRIAAAGAGAMLVLLTLFFYIPIFVMEIHSPLALEGINYVGDTLLFAGTCLLAGFGADLVAVQSPMTGQSLTHASGLIH